MKKSIAAILPVAIALAGCATASKDLAESHVSPMPYTSSERERPRAESGSIQAGVNQLAGRWEPAAATTACTSANFTSAIYNAIVSDMTLDQVTRTIGCAARLLPVQAPTYMIYAWMSGVAGAQYTHQISVCFDETGTYVRACRRGSFGPLIAWSGGLFEGVGLAGLRERAAAR